jgi:uncharacterized SAM-binding protein YcdF (DUF218 family)
LHERNEAGKSSEVFGSQRRRFVWARRLRLFQYRTVWCPTLLGTFCLLIVLALPLVWWSINGEAFLSANCRLNAEVLVVEGWIGSDGVRAAATEFTRNGYQYIVATGGVPTTEGWEKSGWSYAEGAYNELVRLGVPEQKIIFAPSKSTEIQRTYESARAVAGVLAAKNIHPQAVNVFTLGPHLRRSCMVFSKVLGTMTKVGGIDWVPPDYFGIPWWRSSGRAKNLLGETTGYFYEALFNSGRGWANHF